MATYPTLLSGAHVSSKSPRCSTGPGNDAPPPRARPNLNLTPPFICRYVWCPIRYRERTEELAASITMEQGKTLAGEVRKSLTGIKRKSFSCLQKTKSAALSRRVLVDGEQKPCVCIAHVLQMFLVCDWCVHVSKGGAGGGAGVNIVRLIWRYNTVDT